MTESTSETSLAVPLVVVISRCAWTLHNFRLPLLRAIAASGWSAVAAGQPLGGYEKRLLEQGISFHATPGGSAGLNPAADLRLLLHFVLFFRRMRPQIVHAFTIRPAIFATMAARLARVPVRVVSITGLGHAFTSAGAFLRFATETLYRLALRHADIVFFQNRDDMALFVARRLARQDQARIIPGSGIDTDRFVPRPLPASFGATPTFLMIGRLLREKGVFEYVEAAALVSRDFPRAAFLLIGGSDSLNPSCLTVAEIDSLQRLGTVRWIGEVPDVMPYIASADVVVLPSYREGVPRSLLEGAAMGRALIATDVPGCREIVEHGVTGLLVPVRDANGLAAAMRTLLLDVGLIAALGARARSRAISQFDERVVLQTTLRAYDEILAKKRLATQSA